MKPWNDSFVPDFNFVEAEKVFRDNVPEIRRQWDTWYTSTAPLTTDINVNGYVNRILNMQHLANVVFIPLQADLLSDGPIQNVSWKTSHKYSDKHNLSFEWPPELAAAMNSVTYTGNANPPLPRLLNEEDEVLKENVVRFKDRTSDFYTIMKSKQNNYLKEIVGTQVSLNGEQPSVAQMNKTQLMNKLDSWSRAFFSSIFRPIGSLHSSYVLNFFKCNLSAENFLDVISNPNVDEIKVKF